MRLDQSLGNRQTQTGAGIGRSCFVGAIETIEDVSKIGLRESVARITDQHLNLLVLLLGPNEDLAASRAMTDGVGQQIEQYLFNALGVDLDHRQIGLDFANELKIFVLQLNSDGLENGVEDALNRAPNGMNRQSPGVGQGQLMEVLNQSRGEQDLVVQSCQRCLSWLHQPVTKPFQGGAHGRDRRS